MALSDKDIMSDASKLVTELVTDLDKLGLDPVKQIEALSDSKRVLTAASVILETMLDKKMGRHATHH